MKLSQNGQAVTETIVVLPIFLMIALGVLQLAQLGVALAMANYAASSVARSVVSSAASSSTNSSLNLSAYQTKADQLMVAGMQLDSMIGCVQNGLANGTSTLPVSNVMVGLQAKVRAFPFFGNILHGALGNRYEPPGTPPSCQDVTQREGSVNIFYSNSAPYYFYVLGTSQARMNYAP